MTINSKPTFKPKPPIVWQTLRIILNIAIKTNFQEFSGYNPITSLLHNDSMTTIQCQSTTSVSKNPKLYQEPNINSSSLSTEEKKLLKNWAIQINIDKCIKTFKKNIKILKKGLKNTSLWNKSSVPPIVLRGDFSMIEKLSNQNSQTPMQSLPKRRFSFKSQWSLKGKSLLC